jgi:hypothetical protein
MNKGVCFLFFVLALLLFACNKPSPVDRTKVEQFSFCYWDTEFSLDTTLYQSIGVNHFYVRYFDVDWDPVSEEAKPIASIRHYDSIPAHFTPAVFLTNKVFEKSSNNQLQALSSRITRRIDEISSNFGKAAYYKRNIPYVSEAQNDSAKKVVEKEYKTYYSDILIDCDWTGGTQDKFFYFINCLKKDIPDKNITVTLRLWQYKRQKSEDIPPVNRCLLMCYNMQTANDFNVQNSIASMKELKKYVSGEPYPLPLDVALPIFNWGVLFRNEKFVGLLGNLDAKDYANNFVEYENMGNGRYRSLIDKVIGNYFVRKGDIIRIEGVSIDELRQMSKYLKTEIPMDSYSRVTFFSWNQLYIQNYGIDEIKDIYTSFIE